MNEKKKNSFRPSLKTTVYDINLTNALDTDNEM